MTTTSDRDAVIAARMAEREDKFVRVYRGKGNAINYVPSKDEKLAAIRELGNKQYEALGGHARYYGLLDEMKLLHHEKSRAYGNPQDPFANFTNGVAYGLTKVQMIVCRLADKLARFQNDAKRDFALVPGMGQDNETPEETYMDIASLFLILRIALEERRAQEAREAADQRPPAGENPFLPADYAAAVTRWERDYNTRVSVRDLEPDHAHPAADPAEG